MGMTKAYVTAEGAYLMSFDGDVEAPDGAVEVASAPQDIRQVWDFASEAWGPVPPTSSISGDGLASASGFTGLVLSNNFASPDAVIDIYSGSMQTISKNLCAAWAQGHGQGGLDTGSIAANTTYHGYAIERLETGVVDALFSTSPTNPVMPSGYTARCRIGPVLTAGDGKIRPFRQVGGWFHFLTPIVDINNVTLSGGIAAKYPLTVPAGIKTMAEIMVNGSAGGSGSYLAVCDPDLGSAALQDAMMYFVTNPVLSMAQVWTDTASEISLYTHNGGKVTLYTRGFYDGGDTYV